MVLGDFKTVEEQQEWIRQKLKQVYKFGAKDMAEAVKLKNEFGRYHDQTFEVFMHDIERKAQQFIESLEKDERNN